MLTNYCCKHNDKNGNTERKRIDFINYFIFNFCENRNKTKQAVSTNFRYSLFCLIDNFLILEI